MPANAEQASTEGVQTGPAKKRSMALVMNGSAGALLGQAAGAGSLEDLLRAEAARLEVIPEAAGTLPERMARALETGADCVVVAGGDGTIACAAQALAGSRTALGIIPCGTMNLLGQDLGLDPTDRQHAVRVLGEGIERAIDVGEVTGADGEGHVFLCASMLGTPARLSRHREAGRERGNGVLAWGVFAFAAMRALRANRSTRLVLRYDGIVRRVRTPSLTIAVNRLDDESGRLFGRSRLEGGKLAIYVVRRSSVLGQVGMLLRMAWRGNLRAPEIEIITTEAVEIGSPRRALHVLVDGELRLLGPALKYAIRPKALRVLAPAPPAGA